MASKIQPVLDQVLPRLINFLFPYREVIGDPRTFIAAQKFKKILQLGQTRQAKNVPWFSMTDVNIILNKFIYKCRSLLT